MKKIHNQYNRPNTTLRKYKHKTTSETDIVKIYGLQKRQGLGNVISCTLEQEHNIVDSLYIQAVASINLTNTRSCRPIKFPPTYILKVIFQYGKQEYETFDSPVHSKRFPIKKAIKDIIYKNIYGYVHLKNIHLNSITNLNM